jgi:BMFP domain-containing protein YqiC
MPDEKPVTSTELRAALDAVVEAITARQDRATAELIARQDAATAELTARQDRAVETIAGEISLFRAEVNSRFDTIDRRLERNENYTNGFMLQMSGISRSLTLGERFDTETAVTLAAQRQAIADLARRVEALEKKAS